MTYGTDLAYPDPMRGAESTFSNQNPSEHQSGLTKREYFAVMRKGNGATSEGGLSPLWAKCIMNSDIPSGPMESIEWWVEAEERYAVMRADALIKVLNEPIKG